ncbi:hypothetical protein B566_EDAN001610 [Ephemera danica]|nr:hypothetical protein B566_EDAN001610 [Ephemera danica]
MEMLPVTKGASLTMSEKLKEILGFAQTTIHFDTRIIAPRAINIKRALPQQLFIPTDLIHNQLVGGSYEKLLRVVNSPMATELYTQYYLRQAEGRYGGDYRGMTQKGDGLGSFLGGLFRRIFPLFSSGAKVVGREALSTGVNLLRDAISGRSMKESVRERVKQAGTNLTNKAAQKMESMVGSGYKKRKRRRRNSVAC